MTSTVTRRNLQSQFPDCDPQLIAEVLRDSHGDFNMAVSALRDMGMKDHSTITRDTHSELSGLFSEPCAAYSCSRLLFDLLFSLGTNFASLLVFL
jgi:hypothetical protein